MTPPRTLRSSTSLKVAVFAVDLVWYLSCAVAVLAIASLLVISFVPHVRDTLMERGVITPGERFSLPLTVEYPHSAARDVGPGATGSLKLVGHDDVVFERPFDRRDVVFVFPFRIVMAIVVLWTLFQLRSLMHAVKRGHPFDPRNPVRIRRIAYMVIAAGVLGSIARWVSVAAWFSQAIPVVKRTLPGAFPSYHVSFEWRTVVGGLIILAIAHAFDAGTRLQNDQDLTV